MKKIRLRRWVKVVLIIGIIFSIVLGACEVESTKLFFIKGIISLVMLLLNSFILLAFGDDHEYRVYRKNNFWKWKAHTF